MEPRIQYARTKDGVSIAYCEAGEGTPFLSVAAPYSNIELEWRDWEWHRIMAARRRLIRFDNRGSGLSQRDVADVSLDAMALDIGAVADALRLETFALYGEAWAVPVVISYAAKHPGRVSHLILFGGFARAADFYDIPRVKTLFAMLDQGDWELFTDTMSMLQVGWQLADVAHGLGEMARACVTLEQAQALFSASRQYDVTPLLPNVRVPTLVLHSRGTQYPTLQMAQTVAAGVPGARLRLLESETLWSNEMEPQFLDALDEFIGDGGRPTAADVLPHVQRIARAAQPPYTVAATARLGAVSPLTFAAGRYTVKRLLGEGAQKTVYLVRDTALERDCALALLKTEVLDADGLARVRREGQAMARLAHPNIVTVHDIGDEDGRPYLVCEYVTGGDLRQELDRAGGALPVKRALAIAGDVCRALAFAHSQGIIHRDVKPGNVHLARDGSAKLGDFGLALAADQSRLTMAGTAMGTAPYMAPEQARGQPVDARSDLYSLGCLLYELVTGRPPFTGDDPMAVVSQHVHAQPEPPSRYNPEIPHDLEQLVLALLAKARDERPSSADEALAELQRIAAEG